MVVSHAEFYQFRGFRHIRVPLAPNALIVGPNSAGKSTVIEALALAELCLQRARRQAPSLTIEHRGATRRAHLLPTATNDDTGEDPVRHEFGDDEARVEVHWSTGSSLHLVWPEDTEDRTTPYFYLEVLGGFQPNTPARVKSSYTTIATVPVVTPLDRFEELKSADYVKRMASSRLASRHFRNHALQLQSDGAWENFREFANDWTPEIELLDPAYDYSSNRLSVFYTERGSRVPKELAWAGDGMQIWLQLLWHAYRSQNSDTLLLDEPEVYLHPDLQRRLIRLLDSLGRQVILATHSAEMIAEAAPDDVLWVDRRAGSARKAKSQQSLAALSNSLGSNYNLALARSMRSELVLASDCKELEIIRLLAERVGARRLASDHTVTLLQLVDVSGWHDPTRFATSIREVLPPSLPSVMLLQGGLRSKQANQTLIAQLAGPNSATHILAMAEIENYLLHSSAIARVTGAAPESIDDRIDEITEGFLDVTRSAFLSEVLKASTAHDAGQAVARSEGEFYQQWADLDRRRQLVPGSLVLQQLNYWLERESYKTVRARSIARIIRPEELPTDIISTLLEIDEFKA